MANEGFKLTLSAFSQNSRTNSSNDPFISICTYESCVDKDNGNSSICPEVGRLSDAVISMRSRQTEYEDWVSKCLAIRKISSPLNQNDITFPMKTRSLVSSGCIIIGRSGNASSVRGSDILVLRPTIICLWERNRPYCGISVNFD